MLAKTLFTQNLGYLSNNPVAVNGRQFTSRIKVIVLSNLISISVSNFSGRFVFLDNSNGIYLKGCNLSNTFRTLEAFLIQFSCLNSSKIMALEIMSCVRQY